MSDPRTTEPGQSPEEVAVTGGVPAAAEPSPMSRGRRRSTQGPIWVFLLIGCLLVLTAILADRGTAELAGTAIAGAALIAISLLRMAGVLGPALTAIVAFLGGAMLTIVALAATDFGFPELVQLVAGAVTFIGAFAILAAGRQEGDAPGEDEPGASVESV